ncbi:hypothetical protein ISN45_At01g035950 [Arabidopsis thaliana x Arabidopsis arenosa]|uniref:Uncharacterized protein n=2 Tax=Arabidopsis TaxID=3701 RepID=A0A8T2HBC3_ARASU|nr:hypothetical protein ISN45_At01g035950 [Arabidopsis thaliana x Arabidopsis arenosa]KAG7656507.1 hypothetical protein ISN44_As01g035330 [Arabidopsis suecica]
MSEQASLFQSSIRLLGEYCPISRKKSTHKVGGLRFEEDITSCIGFQFMQLSDYHCLF